MKNICNLILLLILAISLQGCFSMQDEVWIESDGSGRFEATTDLSSMYPFLMMGLQEEMGKDKNGKAEESDPFTGMMKGLLTAEEVDTTFEFREMISSALAEDGMSWDDMLDSLRNAPADADMSEGERDAMLGLFDEFSDMRMRMRASQDEQIFKTTSIQDFTSIGEMGSVGNVFVQMMEIIAAEEGGLGQGDEVDAIMQQMMNAQTQMDLDGNTLRVRRAGMDVSLLGEEFAQNFAMVKMFLGNDPYRMTIHFPGKVKKISSDVAEKVDKNTVTIEMPLDDLFDPEKQIDVEIQFKGLKKR